MWTPPLSSRLTAPPFAGFLGVCSFQSLEAGGSLVLHKHLIRINIPPDDALLSWSSHSRRTFTSAPLLPRVHRETLVSMTAPLLPGSSWGHGVHPGAYFGSLLLSNGKRTEDLLLWPLGFPFSAQGSPIAFIYS